jgi:hypothetical protein
MTTTSHRSIADYTMHDDNLDAPDDKSDSTTPTGFIATNIEHEMVTKVIKFSFTTPTNMHIKQAPPAVIHTHWMHAIQAALGDDIIIWNNKGDKVEKVNVIRWTGNPTIHQKQFQIHQKITGGNSPRRTIRHYIVHRIITSASIASIKQIPEIHQILRDNNCYLNEHPWNEDAWDTTKIGFVTNLDPRFYTPDQAQMKFNKLLKEKIKQLNTRTKMKIPHFRMIFSSPKIRSENQTTTTKAYAIEVKHEDTTNMLQILKSLLRDTPTFVPFTMRNKFPEGFKKAIKYQTQRITSHRTIVLQYLHPDMMFHIEELIKTINGVIDVMPDKRVLINGKYRILVAQDKFKTARDEAQLHLAEWCDEYIPTDAYPKPNPFPDRPRVQPIHNDGFSSGENSWMSLSNTSFMSMDLSNVEDDAYFSNTAAATKAFTYAEIIVSPPSNVAGPSRNRPTIDQNDVKDHYSDEDTRAAISEITTTARTETEQQQRRELEHARQIIADQQAEIQKLKENQEKSQNFYEETFARLHDEIREQSSNSQSLKNEVETIIQQQQTRHAHDLQELYDRMMRQMTTMFLPLNPIPIRDHHTDSPSAANDNTDQLRDTTNNAADPFIATVQHRDKKQDTRPTPTKRKLTASTTIEIEQPSSEDLLPHRTSPSTTMMDTAPCTQEHDDDV